MSARVVACPSCGTKNRVPVAGKGRAQCASCHTSLPWLVDAGDDDFTAATETGQLVLVDLWAPWCGPCRQVAPVLERLATHYAGRVKVVKVNVDDNPGVAGQFGVANIPTIVVLKNGSEVKRFVGLQQEADLAAAINAALK